MPATAPVPTISVIVPVYEVVDHVAAAIASLKAQSFADFEALVVNDASPDDSAARARAAAGGDPRFRFIDRAENGGLSAARNTGLEAARGAFVAFLDSDDRFAPNYLERLHDLLEESGADWIACALRYVHPGDESGVGHPAIHGPLPQAEGPGPLRRDLGDWTEVVRHFPSAWNKLYRRSLIEGLRFDEGTYYEDHAFFYRVACRTDHLLYLPEPLYLQSQGREGQITREDSDRVFEQFAVLETMKGVIDASDKTGKGEGFRRIATRLIFERSTVLLEPTRRARFAAAAGAFLARHGIDYSPNWDPGIGRSWGVVVAGRLPASVVIPSDGNVEALTETLAALDAQALRDFEILVVPDAAASRDGIAGAVAGSRRAARMLVPAEDPGVAAARNAGLAAARGDHVIFLDAGDRLQPGALGGWAEGMIRNGADLGLSRFRMGGPDAPPHPGLHDTRGLEARLVQGPLVPDADLALRLHANPSARIFRRAFLEETGIRFPPGPLSSWSVTLRAALAARLCVYFTAPSVILATRPETRRLWRAPVAAEDLAAALEALAAALPETGLPAGWRRRLAARAIWEKLNFADFPDETARDDFSAAMRARAARWAVEHGDWSGPLDPYIGPRVLELLDGTG